MDFLFFFYFKYSAFSHLASCAFGLRLRLGVLASFFSFFYACVSRDIMHGSMSPCIIHGTHKNFIKKNRYIYIYIKNGSHGIIYTFKNYFVIVFQFLIFNKINDI